MSRARIFHVVGLFMIALRFNQQGDDDPASGQQNQTDDSDTGLPQGGGAGGEDAQAGQSSATADDRQTVVTQGDASTSTADADVVGEAVNEGHVLPAPEAVEIEGGATATVEGGSQPTGLFDETQEEAPIGSSDDTVAEGINVVGATAPADEAVNQTAVDVT